MNPPACLPLPARLPAADLLIALAGPLTHIPQLIVWLALLFPAYHAAYGSWGASLAIPPPSQHFWLAVVAGACQVCGCLGWESRLPCVENWRPE